MSTSSARLLQQTMDSDPGRHILDDPDIDREKQSGNRWLKLILHHLLWTHLWQLWLVCTDNLHHHDKDAKEGKRLEKLQPRVIALYSRLDLVLACERPIFELHIQEERMKLQSRKLETWVRLVTPAVK